MLTSYLIYTKDTAAMAAFYHKNLDLPPCKNKATESLNYYPLTAAPVSCCIRWPTTEKTAKLWSS